MENLTHVVCPACNAVNRIPGARLGEGPRCGKCRKRLFGGKPVDLDAAGFQRQIAKSDIPVLVDFWAPWCGPCKMMAPAYEAAAGKLEPAVRVAKLNTEDHQVIGASMNIRSIPTLALFKGGAEIARQPGAMGEAAILSWVESHL